MYNGSLLTKIALFWVFVIMAPSSFARVQDYTLDYSTGESAIEMPVPVTASGDTPDPWTAFLAAVPHFSEITWGMDLQGAHAHEQNIDLPTTPASIMKMITAATALRNGFGSQAKYENYFEAQIDPASKVASSVKFTVSGDPTWGHSEYESPDARLALVIKALKAQGVKQVSGPITIVSTREGLDQIPRPGVNSWPARWDLQCMATLPTSFMFNGNCGTIQVTALTKANWTTPGVDVPIHLNLKSGSTNNLVVKGNLDSFGRVSSYSISGTFAHATSEFVDPLQVSSENKTGTVGSFPVHLGSRWLKNLFLIALSKSGITYQESGKQVVGTSLMVDLSSSDLLSVLRIGVKKSINAILDRAFIETAMRLNQVDPSIPSFEVLREVVNDDELIKDVRIGDGSGLKIDDRFTAHSLYVFLKALKAKPYFQDFVSVLATPGEAGTLSSRLMGPLTKGKIFAKTGTIDGFANLAGYFQTPSGSLEPFVIFTSSKLAATPVRASVDAIVTEFASLNASIKN